MQQYLDDSEEEPKPSMSQEAMLELNKMRLDNTLCDAVLQVDGPKKFNVHRNILCACSQYFRALFTSDLNDGDQQEFVIVGIRPEMMEAVINYAYLRHCKITDQTVHELFVVSDYMATIGLLRNCVQYMVRMLNAENCVGLMLFARERFSELLYEKARYYLLRNFVEVADHSQELLQIDINDFVQIVSDDLLNVKNEEIVWTTCIKWIDQDPPDRKQEIGRLLRACRLGLLNSQYFMEHVKEQKYVIECEETRAIVIEALTFLYDLDLVSMHDEEVLTPAMAVPRLPHEVIFAIGGWSEGMPQRFIETYDTRADRWIRVFEEDPIGPRAYHGTAVIGYKLYCIGGFDGVEYYNTCRCFDAVTRNWSEIAPMHSRRCYVSVTVMQGKIYALGGYDGHNRQNTAERYDPRTNQWTVIAPMHSLRSDADACCLDDKVYITGGFNGQECLNSAEFYDDASSSWTQLPHMLSRRSGVSCVAHKGRVYVIGGFNGLARLQSGEYYTPAERRWHPIREMYSPRSNFGLEIIDDMLFAIGGFNGLATISQTECYVPETNEWLEATDMGIIRSALTANVVAGLPNVREYIHKDRDRLMEDRRLRILHQQSRDSLEHLGSDEDIIEVD